MKFTVTKTFDINLNVEKIVRDFGFTNSTPKEEIIQQIDRFLSFEDDVIYYNITAEEVYEGYKDEFKRAFEAQKK